MRRLDRPLGAAIVACSLICCSPKSSPPQPDRTAAPASAIVVDDGQIGSATDRFSYKGNWQHVSGRADGRYNGTSSRSFTPGETASIAFYGRRLQLYGVDGPHGGDATIAFDGHVSTVTFLSKTKRVDALVFTSPLVPEGPHSLVVVVGDKPNGSAPNGFVNIDYARIER